VKVAASLASGLAASALALSAVAQTTGPDPGQGVALRWNAPSECPTRDQVLGDVRSLSLDPEASTPATAASVEAVVERVAAGHWRLTLSLGGAQQQLEASSCAQLARATALFVALVMDPSRHPLAGRAPPVSEVTPPAPSPQTTQPRPSSATAQESLAEERDDDARPRHVSVLGAAGLMIEGGALPRAELLGTLEVGIRTRRVELTLEGRAGPAQDTTTDGRGGARLRPLSATLTPCYTPFVTRVFRLGPCAQGEVGWLHAEGIGASEARATDAAWLSLGGEVIVWWILGAHFEARLGAGVLIPVVRPSLELSGYVRPGAPYLTGPGTVFEPGVAVSGGTALVIRF
jgi:hypothetical protein